MSAAPQELTETSSQMFASMNNARSQSATSEPAELSVSTLVAYTIAIPSTVALVISAYLAYATFTMSDVAGCGGGSIFDCGHVLHSKWSKAAGVPVSVFALVTHAILISGLFVTISQRFGSVARKLSNGVVLTAAISASLAAVYFITLQVFVLKHLCSYCMVAHACGLIVGSMAVWKLPVSGGVKKTLASVSLLGIAGLATIQIASAEPPKYKIDTFTPVPSESSDQEGDTFESPSDDGVTCSLHPSNRIHLKRLTSSLLRSTTGRRLSRPSNVRSDSWTKRWRYLACFPEGAQSFPAMFCCLLHRHSNRPRARLRPLGQTANQNKRLKPLLNLLQKPLDWCR